jgi:hypothetical protein
VPPSASSIYSANITKGSLKLRESRIVAGLLMNDVSAAKWKEAIEIKNVLQARSVATAISLAGYIRSRLEYFDRDLWKMVRDGDRTLACQSLLVCAMKHSALLRDFMDLNLRDEYRKFRPTLATNVWMDYLEGCRSRDPDMPEWFETTKKRLRSTVFQILAQAGYLSDTSARDLKTVTILPELISYLRRKGENQLIRCLQLP